MKTLGLDLKIKPFCLSEHDISWVMQTYTEMTIEEKIGQLFCPIVYSNDEAELRELVQSRHIGGVLYRPGEARQILKNHTVLQEASKIPLLIAANLEDGGIGAALEGTYFGKPMLVAATDDVTKAYQLGKVACSEGRAVGVNWAFAPIVDIDYNFRNPITNVRTFGSDPTRIIKMAKAYLKAAQEENVAVAIKHFPGDGVDERDHHLLTSVNSLTWEEWNKSFGSIYRELIDAGVLSIMVGHIAFPAYEGSRDQHVPATLSKSLLQKLLRKELGFNGLICTDATSMVGFCSAMERERAVPLAIESGCDVFLFNKDLDEDYEYMLKGYRTGLLSERRLEEAVLRILATKAALGLHERQANGTLTPREDALQILRNEQHVQWARDCADRGVTLVKDTDGLLPLKPDRYRRVLLQMLGNSPSMGRVSAQLHELLTTEGFNVIRYTKEDLRTPLDTVREFKRKYDLVLYVANIETVSNQTVARINWHTMFGQGNNIPWFVKEVPTVFVSVGNPYHLFDVPMISTFINAYCNSEYVIDAVVDKLIGRSEFKGINPVDPFCGGTVVNPPEERRKLSAGC